MLNCKQATIYRKRWWKLFNSFYLLTTLASNSSTATICISLFSIHTPTYKRKWDEKRPKRLDLNVKIFIYFVVMKLTIEKILIFFPLTKHVKLNKKVAGFLPTHCIGYWALYIKQNALYIGTYYDKRYTYDDFRKTFAQ